MTAPAEVTLADVLAAVQRQTECLERLVMIATASAHANPDALLRPAEAAEVARVSRPQICSWLLQKLIPHSRVGRVCLIRRGDLLDFVARHRVPGRPRAAGGA